MDIYKVSWGIYSTVGVYAMTSGTPTPCVIEKVKRFKDEEKATAFCAQLKEAANVLGLMIGSEFRVNAEIEKVE